MEAQKVSTTHLPGFPLLVSWQSQGLNPGRFASKLYTVSSRTYYPDSEFQPPQNNFDLDIPYTAVLPS